jgi:asparagine synthase (glutamine-hydrolysing)
MFQEMKGRKRPYMNAEAVLRNFDRSGRFSRKIWGLLSLELWHQLFHDRAAEFKAMARDVSVPEQVPQRAQGR